jgi:hypothetical protein
MIEKVGRVVDEVGGASEQPVVPQASVEERTIEKDEL